MVGLAASAPVGARGGAPRCARRLGGGAPRAGTCSAWPSARRRPRAPGAAARARFVQMPSAWVSGGAGGVGALGGFGVQASMCQCPCPFVSLHSAASPRSVALCAVPSTSASLLSSVPLTTGVLFGVRPRPPLEEHARALAIRPGRTPTTTRTIASALDPRPTTVIRTSAVCSGIHRVPHRSGELRGA